MYVGRPCTSGDMSAGAWWRKEACTCPPAEVQGLAAACALREAGGLHQAGLKPKRADRQRGEQSGRGAAWRRGPSCRADAAERAQVICDHLGWGVKTGLPYIWHSKASNPFVNLRKEFKGIFWQEDIVPFFQGAALSPAATTAAACYLELAEQARPRLHGLKFHGWHLLTYKSETYSPISLRTPQVVCVKK